MKTQVKTIALAVSCALIHGAVLAQESDANTLPLDDSTEVIEVKGIRSSQAAAIDLKRVAATIVDSIVAEDIGKLPDATIADSLSRISGVQVKREANEATSLNIRGMPQVLTTLNGEQFLSPWTITDVGANYGDIPASMITGVDVYKSINAKALSGGISGLVDLKTANALTLKKGWTGNLRMEGSQGDLTKEEVHSDRTVTTRIDHNINAFVGYNGGKFGFTAGLFDSESNAANYQMWDDNRLAFLDSQGGQPGDPLDLDNDGDLVNDWYMVPGNFGVRSNFMERKRSGGALGIEVQLTDNFKLSGDVFYTQMDQYDRGVNINFNGQSSINSISINNGPQEQENLYNVLVKEGTITSPGADINYVDADGNTQTKTIHTVQVAHINSRDFQTNSNNTINHTAAINSNLQLDYNNHDNIEASIRYVYAHAEKQYRTATLNQGTPAWLWVDEDGISGHDPINVYDVVVDYRGDVPSFAYDPIANDLSKASYLRKYQAAGDGSNTEADLDVLRADVTYFLNSNNFIQSVDGGLRRGVRQADHTKFFYATPTGRYSTWNDATVPEDKRYKLLPGNEVWQKYPEWRDFYYELEDANLTAQDDYIDNGFSVRDTDVFTDFGPITGFENGVSSLDPNNWDSPLDFLNTLYPGTKTIEDPGFTYAVKETSTSAFLQANFANDEVFFGIPVQGDIGVRVVRTDREITKAVIPAVLDRNNSVGAGSQPWQKIAFVSDTETVDRSFTDVLPSLNLNFFPSDEVILRLGVSKNMTRNNLENLGSGLVLWYQQCVKTAADGFPVKVRDGSGQLRDALVGCSGGGSDNGNPDMKPWRATVYNSSVEWYFAENSIIGIGMFLIDVESAVASYQEQRNFADADGINRGRTVNVWTTGNVNASDLMGLEIGYKQPFTFFENPILSSLGVEFNYTYSDSESPDIDVEGNALPLPSNSKHQSNAILWYDKDGLNMRVAYNWRSEEYIGRVGLNTNGVPLNLGNWNESIGYLDAQINYWVNEHVSFSLSGTNLTSEDRKSYAQFENQFQSLWVQERRYTLGMSLSF
ncbi:TonB-dependent receptor [Flavobacterium sp. W21_SRS_FM6]|uniref:TonB-dependent receptor n=1 Tax=Flavobacterium sp. W21_SRS_FM6 TaxID=3240268 RepID=UPI003F903A54